MTKNNFLDLLAVYTKEQLNDYIKKNGKDKKHTAVLIYRNTSNTKK